MSSNITIHQLCLVTFKKMEYQGKNFNVEILSQGDIINFCNTPWIVLDVDVEERLVKLFTCVGYSQFSLKNVSEKYHESELHRYLNHLNKRYFKPDLESCGVQLVNYNMIFSDNSIFTCDVGTFTKKTLEQYKNFLGGKVAGTTFWLAENVKNKLASAACIAPKYAHITENISIYEDEPIKELQVLPVVIVKRKE